jgi:NAD(P)H-flavin reductase/ferredoxin
MNSAVICRPVTVSFSGLDAVIDCAPGESILYAGLRAGLRLPYECASGGCGSCRAQLLAGSVHSRWDDATGLTERDLRRGDRILMCQSIPVGPCELRVPLSDVAPSRREPLPARLAGRLVERELLSPDTARFVIEVGSEIEYLPGQFVLLELEDGTRRAYSMIRPMSSARPGSLELLIRAKPGGAASRWLFGVGAHGAEVVVEGAYGKAYAQSPADRPVVCLAGGTGLAPVLAIAEQLASDAPERRIDVYVGSRHTTDLVLVDRLLALAGSGVRVIPVVEQQGEGEHNELGPTRKGLALDHLADDWPELGGHDVYVAGPAPMIDATLRRLIRNGSARADRVFFDRFIA